MSVSHVQTATFRPRARLLSLLGEQLISDQAVGLIELVKNAYDADATCVEIELTGLSSVDTSQIVLRDNGFGMSLADIEQKWLSPAVDHKERQKKAKQRTPRGRLPIGEKGVGRFAVHQLGRRFQLISRMAKSSEVVLEINWDDFESGDVFLDDVTVTLFERPPELFAGDLTGTYLRINQARSNWTDGMVAKVQRALRRLQSPHQSAGDFKIELRCPDFPTYEQISSSDILERAHYVFRGQITTAGWLDYEYRCLHPTLPERAYTEDSHNLIPAASREMASFGANGCGPFFVTFYVWDRTQEFLNQSGVARADLDAMSGVSLFLAAAFAFGLIHLSPTDPAALALGAVALWPPTARADIWSYEENGVIHFTNIAPSGASAASEPSNTLPPVISSTTSSGRPSFAETSACRTSTIVAASGSPTVACAPSSVASLAAARAPCQSSCTSAQNEACRTRARAFSSGDCATCTRASTSLPRLASERRRSRRRRSPSRHSRKSGSALYAAR